MCSKPISVATSLILRSWSAKAYECIRHTAMLRSPSSLATRNAWRTCSSSSGSSTTRRWPVIPTTVSASLLVDGCGYPAGAPRPSCSSTTRSSTSSTRAQGTSGLAMRRSKISGLD
eukprot:scaffold324_cov239-Pinguiococcus_pyrenoidosus.AAC.5